MTYKLIIFLFIIVIFASGATQGEQLINPYGRDFTIMSLLRLNDSVIGDIEITITKEQQIKMAAEPTINLLKNTLNDNVLDRLSQLQKNGFINNDDFEALGVKLIFDMASLELVLAPNVKNLKVGNIDFNKEMSNRTYLVPSNINGYMNVSASVSRTESNTPLNDISIDQNYTLNTAVNYKKMVLEYESIYSNIQNQDNFYARQGTRAKFDLADQGTRITFGDYYYNAASFQDGGDILGLQISRDFAVIPTKNVRPTASRQFTLQRSSTVDVMIDGVVVRRLTLGAGSYNLQDIPLVEGVSDLELVIIDSNGQEERINFSIATGMDLLKENEFEYNINGGFKSNVTNSEPEYNFNEYIVNAKLEYGISTSYTLGVNFQFSQSSYQIGQRNLFATGIGLFDIKSSYSHNNFIGEGVAISFGYDLMGLVDKNSAFEFSIYYDFYSRFFIGARNDTFINIDSTINANQHFIATRLSYNFDSNFRASLNTSYVHSYDYDMRYWTISPSVSGQIFDTKANWSFRLSHKQFLDNKTDFSGLLTLSWPLGFDSRVVSSYQTERKEISSEYSYRKNIGNSGGIAMFAGATHSEDSNIGVDAGIDYDANRFLLNAQHTSRYTDLSNDTNDHYSQLRLASGVAFSGSDIAIGRPIRESFAIVKQHNSIKENRAAISPTAHGARVYSDNLGPMLIPDLAAYNEQILNFEVDNLPVGYDLGAGVFMLSPGYSQGYSLQIGSDAAITVIGTLVDNQSKDPISLTSAKALLVNKEQNEPLIFFTNRAGRFAITGIRPGTYEIELNTEKLRRFKIIVKDDSDALLRLGTIYVD
ncbi:MAG: outer membrane usher protein [Cognaticolwellia sp.]|jgi:outer membrane usher protein